MFRLRPILRFLVLRRHLVRHTSSVMTEAQIQNQLAAETETRSKCAFRCATFNLLAPCYKNIGDSGWWSRWESSEPEKYLKRYENILDFIVSQPQLDLICLQEFWFKEDVQGLFQSKLETNYSRIELKRQGWKTDGLAILVHRSLQVLAVHHLRFSNPGNRVGLMVHVAFPDFGQELILMTTHLNYCHSHFDQHIRMSQIQAVLDDITKFIEKNNMEGVPVLLAGDFNTPQEDPVYEYVKRNKFKSSYKEFHGQEPGVTHRDHNGQNMAVDYIFYRNAKNRGFVVKSSKVLPAEYDSEGWPEEFDLSDHRMIVTEFELDEKK